MEMATELEPLYDRNMAELSSGATDFGVRDEQGRAVGYSWRICSVTYTPVPAGQRFGYRAPAGKPCLSVDAYPTRNGRHYGASSREFYCHTQAEADAFIARRIEDARKRETKRFKVAA